MVENVGIVLVTHGGLGAALVETCRMITGGYERLLSVSVGSADEVGDVHRRIESAIAHVRGPTGVILLVDMFGGTPSNISLSFLSEGSVEVVTGVNLPMLTKLASLGESLTLREAARVLRDHGREHIKAASDYLNGK